MAPDRNVDPLGPTIGSEPSHSGLQERLPRGAQVERYIIVDTLGEGGMGIVYAAYDSKLDRRVALKAMHATGDPARESVGRGRLVREARAMARLSHPNVVTVYDVVAIGEDQLLVAMELVEGRTLRAWLAERLRTWREVVSVFVQAGRGLAAAHDAELVHRDFKLDNVLVGNDGRARVGDFGLARSRSPEEGAGPASNASPMASSVTQAGAVLGTPQYMAPDQLEGAPSDVRSDQFSFCAALYEGLYGVAPFEGTSIASLSSAIREQRLRPPPQGSAVPGWLRAVVLRGLRARPGERFPTMHEVLAALQADPTRTRARWAAAGLVVAVATVASVALVQHRRAAARACVAEEHRVDGVWNGAARDAIRASFLSTGRPYAQATFDRVARALDAYAAAWSHQAGTACEQARTASPGDDRVAWHADCLESRLGDERAFVTVLQRADGESVDRAVQAVHALPSVASCAAFDPRVRPWPTDRAVRALVRALSGPVSEASVLDTAGRFTEAAALAARNEAEAERIGFMPLEAETLQALAATQEHTGDLEAAKGTYLRATLAAEASDTATVAARAWTDIGRLESDAADYPRADESFAHAGAWAGRAGDDEIRARLFLAQGARFSDEGRYDEARQLHEAALAIYQRTGSEAVANALNELGIDADRSGHYDEATAYYEQSLSRDEQMLGPDNPAVAVKLTNIGEMDSDEGKFSESIAKLERALQIEERAHGPSHYLVGEGFFNLASVDVSAGRFADALANAQRAVPIIEASQGPDSVGMAWALQALGEALTGVHRPLEALAPLEHALAIRLRANVPLYLSDARTDLGLALAEAHKDPARARELLQAARDTYVQIQHPQRLAELDAALAKLPPAR